MTTSDYMCCWCGKAFTTPLRIRDYDERGRLTHELLSPCCRGAFQHATYCDECGELVGSTYIKIGSDFHVCDACYTEMGLGDEADYLDTW